MSIRYIFGGAGAGKTAFILSDIVSRPQAEQTAQRIYIVPEQFSLQSEKNLLSALARGGSAAASGVAVIHTQVLSFRRLAFHVFSETGQAAGSYLEDIGKTMLLRKLLYELREELCFFGKSVDKMGFMEQLASAITEFYQYSVSPSQLAEYAGRADIKESLRLKMKDLSLIFQKFTEFIEDRYIATDAMLDVLAAKIDESMLIQNSEIWISGFHGFTPQEYKVLARLMKSAARVTVSLTLKEKAKSFDKPRETDPFNETKRTVNKLSGLATDLNVEIEEPVLLIPNKKQRNSELAFLEENFLSRSPKSYRDTVQSISICCADNRYTEIHQAAADITELVRSNDYSYSDIAVLVGDIHAYERDIRNIFGQYDIPLFTDSKTDILSHPLIELIRAAIDIIAFHWSYENVFRFLKTDMTGLDRNAVDNLENYVLAYGIKGNKWNMERWKFGFEKGFDEEEIHNAKDFLRAALEPLTAIRPDSKRTVREISGRIFKMLNNLLVNDTLDRWIEEMEAADNLHQARIHSQIWSKVCGVFDILVEILGDEKVTMAEFSKILEAGFKATDMGVIPPAQIQTLIGDVERTRLPKIKALLVLGVNEGVLPAIKDEKGLLSDDERRALDPKEDELAPGSKRRGYEQQFLIYQAITTPTEKLFLSYITGQLNGKANLPSILISKMKRLFERLEEKTPDFHERITLARPMFSQMGAVLQSFARDDNISPVMESAYAWFANSEEYSPKLEAMNSLLFETTGGEQLSADTAEKIYGKEFSVNVSKLEKYVQCPYAYFIQHNLGALERKIYEVQSVEIGNLYHDALEMFTKKLEEQQTSWRDLEQPAIDSLVENCIGELAPSLGSEVLLSTARYKYVLKRATRILKKSIWALAQHIKCGEFEIFGTEMEFSVDGPVTAVILVLNNGRKLVLRGRIDRIDLMDSEGKQYVKIIDYKSGNNKFDLSDVYFGTQLQLLLYMDAFIKSGVKAKALPGGVFYFNIDDPMLDYGDRTPEETEAELLKKFKMSGLVLAEEAVAQGGLDKNVVSRGAEASLEEFNRLREQVIEKVKEIGEKMTSGDINILPYKKGKITGCTYCRYGAICRFEK